MTQLIDERFRLCAITDDLRDGVAGLVTRATQAAAGGVTLLVLRLAQVDARELVGVAQALMAAVTIPVVVRERLDVALASGASGVLLDAQDLPPVAVRQVVPPGFLVGGAISAIDEVEVMRQCDFYTCGPVFGRSELALGPAGVGAIVPLVGAPVIAVGGIETVHLPGLRAQGASGVALLRGVLGADDPERAAREYTAAWRV